MQDDSFHAQASEEFDLSPLGGTTTGGDQWWISFNLMLLPLRRKLDATIQSPANGNRTAPNSLITCHGFFV